MNDDDDDDDDDDVHFSMPLYIRMKHLGLRIVKFPRIKGTRQVPEKCYREASVHLPSVFCFCTAQQTRPILLPLIILIASFLPPTLLEDILQVRGYIQKLKDGVMK
jgi:hypothetical protein